MLIKLHSQASMTPKISAAKLIHVANISKSFELVCYIGTL